jgi:hypothetical protein
MARDYGQPAEPWLPTVAEQDARWTEVYETFVNQQKAASAMWPPIYGNG